MDIVGITVGRRDENNFLRPLNAEELSAAESRLGGRIINIPLMAGFDLDAPEGGPTPTDLLAAMTLENWQQEKLDWDYVSQCRTIATKRFTKALSEVMAILDGMIVGGRNVFFAHTMAGGIPKAKVPFRLRAVLIGMGVETIQLKNEPSFKLPDFLALAIYIS